MYLIKNALKNITRNKGRNILIAIIITVITICTCVGLSIHKAGNNLVDTYVDKNPLEISFSVDMNSLRTASDDEKNNFTSLTIDDVKKYADSNLVKDYYYTLEANVDSGSISAVTDATKPDDSNIPSDDKHNEKFANMGDFRITAYSNSAYLEDFYEGTKKIKSGQMVSGSSADDEVVISDALATENDLEVNDTITICSPSDESISWELKIIGIYTDSADSSQSSFIQVNALNAANQLYANLNTVSKILEKTTAENDNKMFASNGLTAKYYLNDNSSVSKFEKEVRSKGLNDYYSVTTNEEEVLNTLKPIKNISSFSFNFLIVIIIIGTVVLAVINFLNIRDRKYEIGVLRAIGMSKFKVTLSLVCEIFIIALASLIIGTTVGTVITQPVTNSMLKNEISSYETEHANTMDNFGGNGFERPSENMGQNTVRTKTNYMNRGTQNNNTNYVDNLKVKLDFITIIQLFGVCILLTIVSGALASIYINKYNPNKILQDRT